MKPRTRYLALGYRHGNWEATIALPDDTPITDIPTDTILPFCTRPIADPLATLKAL